MMAGDDSRADATGGPDGFPMAGEAHGPEERVPRPRVLVALCAAGVVAFNFPMLIVWDAPVSVVGLPLLPVALFAIWAALIAALAIASERRPRAVHDVLPDAPAGPGPSP